ncbi:MAG: hypothetical protein JW715_09265 [Sedimentisphaerales bacterium]|nr:hypothetical protein [Sedimentisphaerales bacterium]
MNSLQPLKVKRKTGNEVFTNQCSGKTLTLKDFWQWSSSDLVSNTTRGVLAEFLVASTLGLNQGVRNEWDAYDLKTENDIKIEVKSAAYLQSWYQKKLSNIIFNVRYTFAWDYKTNRLDKDKKRQADVYVFCLLHHKSKETINPMDLSQWTFYVVPTKKIEQAYPNIKSISLSKLKVLNPAICNFKGLKEAVENSCK